jgi:hypothetical protein
MACLLPRVATFFDAVSLHADLVPEAAASLSARASRIAARRL